MAVTTTMSEWLTRLETTDHEDPGGKPCHDFLYISGAFRRLYPVGSNAKSMSC
jgi:hypothetical protein